MASKHDTITTNLTIGELATPDGEFNYDLRFLLSLQAFRLDLGKPLLFYRNGGGCRNSNEGDSAHNIKMTISIPNGFGLITIPATGADPYCKGMTTWELMDIAEHWCDSYPTKQEFEIAKLVSIPAFSGRGCYPDTHNQCIHLDCGHLSVNPRLRAKRVEGDIVRGSIIKIVRWVRTDVDRKGLLKGYHMLGDMSFAEFKQKYKL